MKRNLIVVLLFILGLVASSALLAQAPAPAEQPAAKKTSAKAAAVPAHKINLNTGNVKDLDALPGVGPAMAQRILDWRKEHGRFQKVEDLMTVKGIGQKKFDKMKPYLTLE
jgi:competence protein ComEA